MKRAILLLSIAALTISGCATKRYGRLQPLTTAETEAYDCRALDIEVAKVEAFRQQVSDGARFNGASVLGFLGDYGIGNASEKNSAERTATQRMNELLAAKASKHCSELAQQRSREPVPVTPPPSDQPAIRQMGNDRVRCVTC